MEMDKDAFLVDQLLCGFLAIAKLDVSFISSHPERWIAVFKFIAIASKQSNSPTSFELTSCLMDAPETSLNHENFGEFVDILISFSVIRGADLTEAKMTKHHVERAVKSLEKLYNLYSMIPKLIETSGLQSQRAWFEFWLPVLSGLSHQCFHSHNEVRVQSLTYLSRIFLSAELKEALEKNTTENLLASFENVIFPLLAQLLKTDYDNIDTQGIFDSRLRAIHLVTKIYLSFLPSLERSVQIDNLWLQILTVIGNYLLFCSSRKRIIEVLNIM
jgi:hypothetical protein